MAIIETDSPEIEKHLHKLVDLVGEAGGWVHPQTKIESYEGSLSVSMDGRMPQNRRFIKLPMQALLNTENLNIQIKKNAFTFDPDKDADIPKAQYELAEAMLGLYNLTGKMDLFKQNCFWLHMSDYPELLDLLLSARATNDRFEQHKESMKKGLKGKALDEFVCKGFIKQRVLGHKDVESQQGRRSIMPIIDFLNHHHKGAAFSFSNPENKQEKGPNILSVSVVQPVVNSAECYAHYSPLDSLDAYLSYNYVEEWAPYVRSVPVEFEVEDLGRVSIKGLGSIMNKNKLNAKIADLRIFLPVLAEKRSDDLKVLSHLLIPSFEKPQALRRSLGIVINNLAQDKKMDKNAIMARVIKAEEAILEKNLEYYKSLKDMASQIIDKKGSAQVLEDIKYIADLQIIKLSKYGVDQVSELNIATQPSTSNAVRKSG